MTVAELIEKLKDMPQDFEVRLNGVGGESATAVERWYKVVWIEGED